VSGLGETVEKQMVGSPKPVNMRDSELPSAERRLCSRSFAEKRTEGFEEFVKSLRFYTPMFCEELLKCEDSFAKECEGCRRKAVECALSTV
jgi:hypothetical protein